jgi:hypothetical protein
VGAGGPVAAEPAETFADPPAGAAPGAAQPDPGTLAELLDGVSSDGLFRRSIAEADWVRRWTIVTDNLAEGVSPRRQLAFAAPQGAFTVERLGRHTVIAQGAYRRYDAFAETVASVSATAVAAVYRALHGPVEAAYRALGYPSTPFEAAVTRALHRLENAPPAGSDLAVRAEGGVWVFVDERLEALPQVEKHLLRMGPRNAELVRVKAREVREALGLPPPARAAL